MIADAKARQLTILAARELAERVEDEPQRRTLLAALDTALFMHVNHAIVDEARLLPEKWSKLGEYATATQCRRDLENVLSGGKAAASGFRPKGK